MLGLVIFVLMVGSVWYAHSHADTAEVDAQAQQ